MKFLSFWLPVILWALLIFNFSSGAVPVASHVYWQDYLIKKTAHFTEYGVFAALIYRGLKGYGVKTSDALYLSLILAIFYGATDEIHQIFTQGRESRFTDVIIDSLGATTALICIKNILPKAPKRLLAWAEKLGLA